MAKEDTSKHHYLLKELSWFGATLLVGLILYFICTTIFGNSSLDIALHDTYFVLSSSALMAIILLPIFILSYVLKGGIQKKTHLFSTCVWILILTTLLIFPVNNLINAFSFPRRVQDLHIGLYEHVSIYDYPFFRFYLIAIILILPILGFRIYSLWKQLRRRRQ